MPKVRILRQGVEEADAGGGCLVRARRQGLVAEYVEVIEAAVDVIEDGSLPLSPIPGGSGSQGAKRLILPIPIRYRCRRSWR